MGVVFDHRDVFLKGMVAMVSLTVLSFAAALVIGTVVAAFWVSPVSLLRAAGTLYVGMVCNTFLAVLMLLFFSGFFDAGIIVQFWFVSAIIVLSAYIGAFVVETVWAGVNFVFKGQAEAAWSLGLIFFAVLFTIVIPQVLRTVVAFLGSIFIVLIKNSALAALISFFELVGRTQELLNQMVQPILVFVGTAVAYFLLAIFVGLVLFCLEWAVAIKR